MVAKHIVLMTCSTAVGLASLGCDRAVSAPSISPDGTAGCRADADCTAAGAGVCDLASNQCVQCTAADHAACMGTTPVCGTDQTCRACAAHSDCDADACSLGDGACVTQTDVAYVDSAGSANSTCDRSAPCTSLAAALATSKHFIRLRGAIDEAVMVDGGRVATILADRGAKLTHDDAAAVLTVNGAGTALTVYDLTIAGNHVGAGVLVAATAGATTLSLIHTTISGHAAEGIVAESGSFTLVRSAVTGNFGGGVVVDGSATFFIVGNTFFANGSVMSTTGGVRINAKQSPSNRLDFNSLLANQKNQSDGGAVDCHAGPMFTASNNLISNTALFAAPTTGTCRYAYSLIQPGPIPANAHNITGDPEFVDPIQGDLHLMSGSPAFHAADPAADVTGLVSDDIDGTPRMPPPATLGAYQMVNP